MPGIVLPEYPYGHPKNSDYAYDKWRNEQDEKMSAEEQFMKWYSGTKIPSDHVESAREAYLAATRAAAQRCVEICQQESPAVLGVMIAYRNDLVSAIKQEFGL